MERSTLRIEISGSQSNFDVCGNVKCSAGLSQVAYSAYHAGKLGWRNKVLPKDEAKAYGKQYLLLCPECAKNTEQQLQPDNGWRDNTPGQPF